jgi:hypothetical protein
MGGAERRGEGMYIEKTVNTDYSTYFVQISFDRDFGRYELRIYDKKPETRVFGVRVSREPIISRIYDMKVTPLDKLVELIRDWERPLKYTEELNEWDGLIPEDAWIETENLPAEPGQRNRKVQPSIPITDWLDNVS